MLPGTLPINPPSDHARGTRATLILALLSLILVVLAVDPVGGTPGVTAHSVNWSCYPKYWNMSPPDNHILKFNQSTYGPSVYCAGASGDTQYTYWTTQLTWGDPDGLMWVYMGHFSENVQEQMDRPYCVNSGTWPYCSSCGCTWKWWSYWWQGTNSWKNQQTNTWQGGPYWHRSGYF